MGKKKFIDRKKCATFQLLARDTADEAWDPDAPDRVFVRVDANPYDVPDPVSSPSLPPSSTILSDKVRSEILGLGLPDDGYNYLLHLREIKVSGGGSSFFCNPTTRMDLVPVDVKAYDGEKEAKGKLAVDEEVARMLEDGDESVFGSDVEELEEDFVAKANVGEVEVERRGGVEGWLDGVEGGNYDDADQDEEEDGEIRVDEEDRRVRRLLDVEFDMLALQEYRDDSDSEVVCENKERDSVVAKLNTALKDYDVDDLDLAVKYQVPADSKRHGQQSEDGNELGRSSADILKKCAEYAEMYSHEDQNNNEMVLYEESSDESEQWDCETIVTTYSNLDNHPGKIQASGRPRRTPALKNPGASVGNDNVIMLKGKEKLPVDYLTDSRRDHSGNMKKEPRASPDKLQKEPPRRRPQEETKEEKKERKAAVKEEKREARRAKKELKGLYRYEANRAQKVAAFSGPSAIRLA